VKRARREALALVSDTFASPGRARAQAPAAATDTQVVARAPFVSAAALSAALLAALALSALPAAASGDSGATPLFDAGTSAFLAGDLARATASWQALVDEGVASAELETNLGLALSRQGKRGLAVLHFERALELDSSDEDAKADLAELRRGNVDRLEGEEDGGGEALFRLLAPLPGTALTLALLATWTLAWAAYGLKTFAQRLAQSLPLGTIAATSFVLALLAGLGTLGAVAHHRLSLQRAVVVAAAAPAREGPQAKASSHFEVHEGTLVRIEDAEAGWRKIKLQNGLSGWVPAEAVEPVVPAAWGGTAFR
jgi:tetratricopeptide (TPR) repeat protein